MSEFSQPALYLSIKKLDLLLHETDLAMTGGGWMLTNKMLKERRPFSEILTLFKS